MGAKLLKIHYMPEFKQAKLHTRLTQTDALIWFCTRKHVRYAGTSTAFKGNRTCGCSAAAAVAAAAAAAAALALAAAAALALALALAANVNSNKVQSYVFRVAR